MLTGKNAKRLSCLVILVMSCYVWIFHGVLTLIRFLRLHKMSNILKPGFLHLLSLYVMLRLKSSWWTHLDQVLETPKDVQHFEAWISSLLFSTAYDDGVDGSFCHWSDLNTRLEDDLIWPKSAFKGSAADQTFWEDFKYVSRLLNTL